MSFIHLRKKDSRGVVTICYGYAERSAIMGAAFWSPRGGGWQRKQTNAIAQSRMLTNPMRITGDVELTPTLIAQAFRTFLIDNPEWAKCTSGPERERFKSRWIAQIMGPDGILIDLSVDGEWSEEEPKGWVFRCIPKWVADFVEDLA